MLSVHWAATQGGNLYFGMLLRTAKDKLYWGYGRITQQTLVFQLWKISHKAHAYQPGKTCGCDLCLTEKVVILLGHDGPEKIPRSTILLNRRTELLQKCRHKRKFTYRGMTSSQKKWNYEYPGNPTDAEKHREHYMKLRVYRTNSKDW